MNSNVPWLLGEGQVSRTIRKGGRPATEEGEGLASDLMRNTLLMMCRGDRPLGIDLKNAGLGSRKPAGFPPPPQPREAKHVDLGL
jgi:hypothetical protein